MFAKVSHALHSALKQGRNTELSFCNGHVRGQHVIRQGRIFRVLTQNLQKYSKWARQARNGAEVSHVYEVGRKDDTHGKHVGVIVDDTYMCDQEKL